MPGCRDLGCERGPALDLLADEEERCGRPGGASASSTAGVPSGCGPSSNVSATPRAVGVGTGCRAGAPARARAATARARTRRRGADRPDRGGRRQARHSADPFARRASAIASTRDAADGRSREAWIRSPAAVEGPRDAPPPRAPSRAHDLGEPEAAERGVVRAYVTAAPAVGHDGTAAHERFEHREAAGGVHEDVARGHPLRHLIGEALDLDARLARVAQRDLAGAASLWPQRQTTAHDRSRRSASSTAPSTSPTPHPPPEMSTMSPCAGNPSAARASSAIARHPELGRGEAVHADDLGRSTRDASHLGDRLRVRDQVDVDAGHAQ